jgi:hypothetical protein
MDGRVVIVLTRFYYYDYAYGQLPAMVPPLLLLLLLPAVIVIVQELDRRLTGSPFLEISTELDDGQTIR